MTASYMPHSEGRGTKHCSFACLLAVAKSVVYKAGVLGVRWENPEPSVVLDTVL